MLQRFNLEKSYQYLLIALAFLLPLTVFGANLIIVIIVALWFFSGNYKAKFEIIFRNKLMIASIIFFTLHVIGLLWTEDIIWGLHIVHKMWYFLLLLPILYTIVEKHYIKYYVFSFLMAMLLTEIISYLIWFEIIETFRMPFALAPNANVFNPTPFMSHISYNPILAFATYLVAHEALFNRKLNKLSTFLYSFFALAMSINMFITTGRAGQVTFFVMLSILIFQLFKNQKIKSILVIITIIPSVFFLAYETSSYFKLRVDNTIQAITTFNDNNVTSIGFRITYAINSWELIKENPLIGVGTGDFPNSYKKINMSKTPNIPNTTNPHNMYVLVIVQLGLLGLVSLMSIFYYQIKLSFYASNKFIRDVGITLPLLFLVLMWSDSYLLGHYTSLLFVFFSSFLYKDFEKS